jgi:lipopolysaccharide biosynthesis glycosyltransferase
MKKLNICFSVDKEDGAHVATVVNSIFKNSSTTEPFEFGILCDCDETSKMVIKTLNDAQLVSVEENECDQKFKTSILKDEEKDFILANMRLHNSLPYIANVMNFARFYLPDHFGKVFDEILYMDVDMIVQGDLYVEIMKAADFSKFPLWAVPMPRSMFTVESVRHLVSDDYRFFNAGLTFFSTKYWYETKCDEKFKEIMIMHKKSEKPLFSLGTQPIINLLVLNNYGELDERFNVFHLGWKPDIRTEEIERGLVIHWNGRLKGWNPANWYKKYWERYVV